MPDQSVFDGLFNSFFKDEGTNPAITDSAITQTTQIVKDNTDEPMIEISSEKKSIIERPSFEFLEYDPIPEDKKLFDINTFVSELRQNDATKNKEYSLRNTNMSAYDLASGCICNIVMKILNYPVQDYSSSWLPVLMRGHIGNAVHNFIQHETSQFTEIEGSLKIPSIHFSGRFDGIIGNNNLIEIKSCTYDDYKKIIKNHQPRINDFYQLITYKYILENYLSEAQAQPLKTLRTGPPRQRSYNFDTFQFIFVCHQIFAADYNSIGEALNDVKLVKQLLNSRYNKFYFITTLTIDLTKLDINQYIDPIKKKIERINYYVSEKKLPDKDDEFVDNHACFFCLYKHNCPYR